MCQGVIVSLVSFKVGRKTNRIILSGIGSHSDLLRDNKKLLKASGWTEDLSNQKVISIESNFTKGWNNWTLESGSPTLVEKRLLSKEYKRVAGDAKSLIAHVKKREKIDDALVRLLTSEAQSQYQKDYAPIKAQYYKDIAPIYAQYHKDIASIYAQYQKDIASIYAQYQKDRAPIWIKLFSVLENRVKELQ